MKSKKIEEVLCEEDTFNEVFRDVKEKTDQMSNLNDSLCSESGKKLLSDLYNVFEMGNFSQIVSACRKLFERIMQKVLQNCNLQFLFYFLGRQHFDDIYFHGFAKTYDF